MKLDLFLIGFLKVCQFNATDISIAPSNGPAYLGPACDERFKVLRAADEDDLVDVEGAVADANGKI
jgi:hypothetical protein